MPEAERQTGTKLRELLTAHGLNPRHDLGQNFLVDLNLLECVVAAGELGPDDVVLEVGTGTGGMTAFLAERAKRVISVEIDPNVHALAREKLAAFDNVTLLCTDVLATKNRLAPEVVAELDRWAPAGSPGPKLVANLPYAVATPVIGNLIAEEREWPLLVVTVQWELAERMRGQPGTNDYGALSVWLQSQYEVEVLRRLGPGAFWPRPKVDSAIVRLRLKPAARAGLGDRGAFLELIRRLFQQRRKVLRKVLLSQPDLGLDRTVAERVLEECGLTGEVRAEEVAVSRLVELSLRLQARGAGEGKPATMPLSPEIGSSAMVATREAEGEAPGT